MAAIEDAADYASTKRGGELASETFDGPTVLARTGLVLGPWSNVGRLPWWLDRISKAGNVLAPGPPGNSIQAIDNRDLADWCLDAGLAALDGAYNLVSPVGRRTMQQLLEACVAVTGSNATLRWAAPEIIEAAGIRPWTDLPIWLPPGEIYDAMHQLNTSKAEAAGLVTRDLHATVADTWTWLRAVSTPERRPAPTAWIPTSKPGSSHSSPPDRPHPRVTTRCGPNRCGTTPGPRSMTSDGNARPDAPRDRDQEHRMDRHLAPTVRHGQARTTCGRFSRRFHHRNARAALQRTAPHPDRHRSRRRG